MKSIQLNVTGMKCGGCVSTVEKILNNSDGIENVSVNLLTESAYFEITHKHIEIERVLENLKENGFPSKIYVNDFSKKINKSEVYSINDRIVIGLLHNGKNCGKDEIDFVKSHQVTGRYCELRNNTPLENLDAGMGDIFIKLAR